MGTEVYGNPDDFKGDKQILPWAVKFENNQGNNSDDSDFLSSQISVRIEAVKN